MRFARRSNFPALAVPIWLAGVGAAIAALTTLSELARLLPRLGHKVRAHLLFVRPQGVACDRSSPTRAACDDWDRSALVAQAQAIAGAEVHIDADGAEARHFGALTSGQALIYRADGALAFAGGLTASRGHEGDAPGQERIFALVIGEQPAAPEAPVFGCALENPNP